MLNILWYVLNINSTLEPLLILSLRIQPLHLIVLILGLVLLYPIRMYSLKLSLYVSNIHFALKQILIFCL